MSSEPGADLERYDRQLRLPEVGERGQRAIEGSAASLAGGAGASVALLYLLRAGVGRVDVTSRSPQGGAPTEAALGAFFRFTGPRAIGAGALSALAHLRRVLELT